VSQQIFRKASLDRLASPEQLDQMLQITDPRGWIALVSLGAVLATAVIWSIVGVVPENVNATGILVKSGGVYEVVPIAGGRVVDVSVGVGERVNEGQVIARVDQPEMRDRLAGAQATLLALQSENVRLVRFGSRDAELQLAMMDRQRATLAATIESQRHNLGFLTEKILSQERLVTDGLLTKPALMGTRQQHDQAETNIGEAMSQLAQLDVRRLELANRQTGNARSSELKVAEQLRTIADLTREIEVKSQVRAPYTGRILEVMTERGSVVGPGEPLFSLDLSGRGVKDLEAILFVPSEHGKQIRIGMIVQIAPSTVKQEEFGLLLGRVTYVADYPATPKGMWRVLKNDKLVAGLAGQDAPYEVHVDLSVDPSTVSGYRWSSSNGPPQRIQSGTLSRGSIAVQKRRPIELVIPLLKKATGV
jgi:HlyD family secretion protein